MKKYFGLITLALLVIAVCAPLAQAAADNENISDIQMLRREIEAMRSEYEARIAVLEQRLDAAEQASTEAGAGDRANEYAGNTERQAAATSISSGVSVSGDSSFNPAIGVIFQGQAWSYRRDPDEYIIAGFPFGGEAGLAPEGFSLAETEIDISANVDDKFTAWLTMPIVIEDTETQVEIEEAWIETLSLPASMSVRMGRFYSNIGYLNGKHSHSWDFADQPLVYQAFLGNQYLDDGLQFRWLAPTDLYLELGAELLRGDRYPASGAANSGVGSHTVSIKAGGDVGVSNSWLAGLSWLAADSKARASGSEDAPSLFTGDSDLVIADFVWKWAPYGNSRERNFKFQAEYVWRDEDGVVALEDGRELPWSSRQQGWYAQAVFQPFPRWRFGARVDRLSGDSPEPWFLNSALQPGNKDPERYAVMVDWSNSEFSRLRFQYNLDDAGADDDRQFGLQYIYSIGAHGAHSF